MTTRVSMEDLIKRCRTAYKLVVLASQRAIELNAGAPKLVETNFRKITTIALEEIGQGKVMCEPTEDAAAPEGGKRKRAAKKKS